MLLHVSANRVMILLLDLQQHATKPLRQAKGGELADDWSHVVLCFRCVAHRFGRFVVSNISIQFGHSRTIAWSSSCWKEQKHHSQYLTHKNKQFTASLFMQSTYVRGMLSC
ncbi:hypothetical protein VPH35_118274 [Triticum aestivum]